MSIPTHHVPPVAAGSSASPASPAATPAVTVHIENGMSYIEGTYHPDSAANEACHTLMRQALGYQSPGAQWSAAYKDEKWDGYTSVYRKWDKETGLRQAFPTGCLGRAVEQLEKMGLRVRYRDHRVRPAPEPGISCAFEENGRTPRDYQEACAELAEQYGRGVIELATGGGKTIVACDIICRLACTPMVFVVPGVALLRQTQKEFEKYLRLNGLPWEVGIVGGGVCRINTRGITVATYQSCLAAFGRRFKASAKKIEEKSEKKTMEALQREFRLANADLDRVESAAKKGMGERPEAKGRQVWDRALSAATKSEKLAFTKARAALADRTTREANKEALRHLVESCKALIIDEAHLAVEVLEDLSKRARAGYYKISLSATPWREDGQDIRIEAATGTKLISISASDLTGAGHLVPMYIYRVPLNTKVAAIDWRDRQKKHVTQCWELNWRIKQLAEAFYERGWPTLIFVGEREHGHLLEGMIKNAVFVPGGDEGNADVEEVLTDEEDDYRQIQLGRVQRNEIVLIATSWAYTGVDAPGLVCGINAAGGRAWAELYQKIGRFTRPAPWLGKRFGIFVDFGHADPELRSHAGSRAKVFRRERAWWFWNLDNTLGHPMETAPHDTLGHAPEIFDTDRARPLAYAERETIQ